MSKHTLEIEIPKTEAELAADDARGDTDSSEFLTLTIPAKFVVCDRCEGVGSHTNPNVDGNGISAEEFEQDPEFRENYFSGLYDVACEECKGARVIAVPDEEQVDPGILKRYYEYLDEKARWERDDRVTRYYESGGTSGSRY